MAKTRVYKIIFVNQGKVYELFAQKLNQGSLFGFIEVEGLLFGEKTSVVVDPSEERLKAEFEGVDRLHIPMHAVIRIDEMAQQGTAKITDLPSGSNVTPFPGSIYTPTKPEK